LGIVFLALAALLSALNETLPADSVMFMIGGENLPWVPVVVLGILGVVFLLTAGTSRREA
jgi:hypothetical protein